eukprot:948809-Pyramimonas_sp.AAC.1
MMHATFTCPGCSTQTPAAEKYEVRVRDDAMGGIEGVLRGWWGGCELAAIPHGMLNTPGLARA